MKKIAVIGGGIYGTTIAFTLAKKFLVDLYEQYDDILKAASGINQFRLHRGYHYPRSKETALTSLASEKSFFREFKDAVIVNTENFYAIAKNNSKTSKSQYLRFLERHNLEYKIADLPLLNKDSVQLILKVNESLLDPKKLKQIVWKKLKQEKVRVFLNTFVGHKIFRQYDHVIIATYAHINKLLKQKEKQNDYQYEFCEKVVVSLPEEFKNKSLVILDGPFMCIDPFGQSKYHLMGNVVHAIHKTIIGKHPKISKKFSFFLNKGIIKNPPITNFNKFIQTSEQFIPGITKAKHIGSMYTFRAVFPNKDQTDERLTAVNQIDKKILTVFSGKIINCVETADELLKKVSS